MKPALSRVLLAVTPMVAVAVVGLGLRVGAGDAMRGAVIRAAPRGSPGAPLAWQVSVFDEDLGIREPAAHVPVDVEATAGGRSERWHGETNVDGVAELALDLPAGDLRLDVRSGGRWLGGGLAAPAPSTDAPSSLSAWARFARREGPVLLDVAVLGQRAASGFPASVWVRASDGASGRALDGVAIEPEADPSFTPAASRVTTDATGWAHVAATPLGYSVPLVLHATDRAGRTGLWAGGLFIAPGAAGVVARDLYGLAERPIFEVTVPTTRTALYVEVDDARGRVWASATDLAPAASGDPRATITSPPLPPGLYWAVFAGDPAGAEHLGTGTLARPFFVAASPEAALAFGPDPETCVAPGDVRLLPRAVSACLAIVAPQGIPRWTALDGFAALRAREARQKARGMAIALGGIGVAVALELLLVLRAVALARAALRQAESTDEAAGARFVGRAWTVAVGVLVGVLGFALLGAMLLRLS